MEREVPEGLRRDQLYHALGHPHTVMSARRVDRCLLCKKGNVNECGLCYICYALLSERELQRANRWMTLQDPP